MGIRRITDRIWSRIRAWTGSKPPPTDPSDFVAFRMYDAGIDPDVSNIVFTWSDNASTESGYCISYRTVAPSLGAWSALINYALPPDEQLLYTVAANVESYSANNFSNGYVYQFKIVARLWSGGTNYDSNVVYATANIACVNAPTDVVAVQTDETTVNIVWTDTANNESGFKIVRSVDGGDYENATVVSANVETWEDTVDPDHTYQYRVSAYTTVDDDAQYSDYAESNEVDQYLNAPASVTATQFTANTINLTWANSSGFETAYQIVVSDNGAAYANLNLAAANATTYQHTPVVIGNTYQYGVYAVATNYSSSQTNSLAVSPTYLYGYPTAQAAESGVLEQWLLNDTLASRKVVGVVHGTTIPQETDSINANNCLYGVTATGVWAGLSPGITFGVNSSTLKGFRDYSTGSFPNLNIATSDFTWEWVANVDSAQPYSTEHCFWNMRHYSTIKGYSIVMGRRTAGQNSYISINVTTEEGTSLNSFKNYTGDIWDSTIKKFRVTGNRDGNVEFFTNGVSYGTGSIAALDGQNLNCSQVTIGAHYSGISCPKGTLYELRISTGLVNNSGGPGGG